MVQKGTRRRKSIQTQSEKNIKKELKKMEALQKDIDIIKATNPNSYWESMSSNIKPVSLLNAVMKLFTLPNDMIVDDNTKKKRNMKRHEK